jgi:hypothetical protein
MNRLLPAAYERDEDSAAGLEEKECQAQAKVTRMEEPDASSLLS